MATKSPDRQRPIPELDRFWSRYLRREIQYALDLSVLVLAFGLAYLLRFDFNLPAEYLAPALVQLPLVVLIQFVALMLVGVYAFVWRYVGMSEIKTFLKAAAYSSIALLLLRLGLPKPLEILWIPRSVILTNAILAFGGLLALRILRRAIYERHERSLRESTRIRVRNKPVLLVGAGRAGVLAVRELRGRGDTGLEPVGFVDDSTEKKGTVIGGLKVLGTTDDIPHLIERHEIDHVVITMADAPAATIRRIVQVCNRAGVRARIIPGYYEVLQGRVALSRFRDVQIEDLLGREPIKLDEERIRELISGKCILLTGAGGSIGSELARQIARFNPLRLVLLERAEGALFDIEREIGQLWPQLELQTFVADVGDEPRVTSVLERTRPQVVFHAAAHKHVPLMEDNAVEAVKNNVLATETLGRAAGKAGVSIFVLISTDKAVRPSSVMGASKRMAELVIQDLDRRYPECRFLAVRFGNVLASAGSVVPIFSRQIADGGPVTVTHPEATRYFMTIPEASQLVLQAGAIGAGGEILILDMGEPVRILDLATDMIKLSGYRPFEDIQVVFTGLRPGEKLREELEISGEDIDRSSHPKIFIGRLHALGEAEIERALAALRQVAAGELEGEVRALFSEFLPESQLERFDAPPVTSRIPANRNIVN